VPPYDPAAHIDADVLPFCDPFTQYSLIAADEAMAQAGLAARISPVPHGADYRHRHRGMTTIDNGLYDYYAQSSRPSL